MSSKTNPKKCLIIVAAFLIASCGQASADFTFSRPTNLGPPIWSPGHDPQGCCFSRDGLELYFSSTRPGGYGSWDIWVATRETVDAPWGEPVNLGPNVNGGAQEVTPAISPDGLELYFTLYHTYKIRVCSRTSKDAPWSKPEILGPPVGGHQDRYPKVSSDGLSLYFASRRPGGYGGEDIWVSTRATTSDPWSEPVNLGPNVNTGSGEVGTSISADGLTLFFDSDRPGGYGDVDIWVTTRPTTDAEWGPPVNYPSLNRSLQDFAPAISPDGSVLYFDSPLAMWQSSITPIVDLNGDGKVDFKDFRKLAQYWGQDEPSCDIGPTPLGDGVVDIQDLIVFSEYLLKEFQPVAHWELDESEGDIAYDSIDVNDGICYGEPLWQPAGGKVDGALQFDGIDDYISTPFVLNPAKGSLSVFAWIKGGAPGQVMISQRDVGRDPGNIWLLADASYGKLMTRLMHPPFSPLVSESVIADDQWHHVGLVFDFIALHRYLYVDGTEVAKDSDFVGGVGSDGGLYIGADKTLDATSFFSGLIDDVRVYSNVLSAEEIAALEQ